MKNIIILSTLILVSCVHKYENTKKQKELYSARKDQPLDTLICIFTLSTGSLDLLYIQGKLTLPTDIKQELSDTLTRDIKVCGKFPKDLINTTSWNFDPEQAYKIVGKTILAITENRDEKVPLFYVTDWNKFYYRYDSWRQKGDLNSYTNRIKMVDGILNNFKFIGQSTNEIVKLLGEPDHRDQNRISYKIIEEYGSDIDPITSTYLNITFDNEFIITNAQLDEWKKNSR